MSLPFIRFQRESSNKSGIADIMRNPTDVVEPPVEEDLPDPSLQVVAWQAYVESLLLVKKDGINCVVIFFSHGLLSITCKQLALLLQNTIVSEWFPSVLKEAEPNSSWETLEFEMWWFGNSKRSAWKRIVN